MTWRRLLTVVQLVLTVCVSLTVADAQVGDACSLGTFTAASVCWSGKAANQDPLACIAGKCASTFAMGDTSFIEDGICFTDGIDPSSAASGTTRKCPERTACVNTTLWGLDDASRAMYNTGRCLALRVPPNFGNLVDKPCQVGTTTKPGNCWLGTSVNESPLLCVAGVCKIWSSMAGIPAFAVDGPCFVNGVDPSGDNRSCPAGSKCVSTLRFSDAVAFPFYADGRCISIADEVGSTATATAGSGAASTTAAVPGSTQPAATSAALSVVAARMDLNLAMVTIVASASLL